MAMATLTSKGQLTVPKPIREYLNLDVGDKIEFLIDDEGNVVITAKTLDVDDIIGMIKTNKRASVTDMKKAINKAVLKRFAA